MARPVKTYFPKTRLSELAARPGGIWRDDAIEGAQKSIETLRGEGNAAILASMKEIEAVACTNAGRLSASLLQRILRLADPIVSLAGTFGYDALDAVSRSMCDLVDGMLAANIFDAAPVLVHAQSMRLLMPDSPQRSAEEVARIQSELAKVIAHYNFGSLASVEAPVKDAVVAA
jgi:hypothetical protein